MGSLILAVPTGTPWRPRRAGGGPPRLCPGRHRENRSHPLITVAEGEVTQLPESGEVIVPRPLTSDALAGGDQGIFPRPVSELLRRGCPRHLRERGHGKRLSPPATTGAPRTISTAP